MATAKQLKARRSRQRQLLSSIALVAIVLIVTGVYLSHHVIAVLQPAGPIAAGEKRLLIGAFLLMLIVVLPVFALTFGFAWRYRESNKAVYHPNWDHSRLLESIWWLVPTGLIAVLAVITWYGTFAYDPYKSLAADSKTMTIQVVALDWRWLFIYPDQHVASINQVVFPTNRPVKFMITSDAPMNSFWIPQLGGQIYAMPGMSATLNLQADKNGTYIGRSANISGKGFSGMQFKASAVSYGDFNKWVNKATIMPELNGFQYDLVAQPTTDTNTYTFRKPAPKLYENIIAQYGHMHGDALDINPDHVDSRIFSSQQKGVD